MFLLFDVLQYLGSVFQQLYLSCNTDIPLPTQCLKPKPVCNVSLSIGQSLNDIVIAFSAGVVDGDWPYPGAETRLFLTRRKTHFFCISFFITER